MACPGCPLCARRSSFSQIPAEDTPCTVSSSTFTFDLAASFGQRRSDSTQSSGLPPVSGSSRTLKRPKRIILVRHGQSEGNVDATVFTREADWRVPLTDLGFQQAEECGKRIRALIEKAHNETQGGDGSDWGVFFYVSPYTRTLQTLRGIGRAFEQHRILGVREEPRLREQDFGNFQEQKRMEITKDARERFGKFFFRFPEGESAADVYDRVTGFLDSFWRDIEWGRMHPSLRSSSFSSHSAPDVAPVLSTADAALRVPSASARLDEGPFTVTVHRNGDDAGPGMTQTRSLAKGILNSRKLDWVRHISQEANAPSENFKPTCGVPSQSGLATSFGGARGMQAQEGRRFSVSVVMVTHGLTSRVFLMRWFRWTVAQFERLSNPRNCEIRAMQLTDDARYSLAPQHSEEEMLSWGFSPCMAADQYARTAREEPVLSETTNPASWACFFDHIPNPHSCKDRESQAANGRRAPEAPTYLDTPI